LQFKTINLAQLGAAVVLTRIGLSACSSKDSDATVAMHEVITQDINAARGYGVTPLPAGRDASTSVTWAPRSQSSKASSPSPQPTSSACKPATLLASSRNHRPLQTIGDDADIGGAPFGVEARSQAGYATICLKSSILLRDQHLRRRHAPRIDPDQGGRGPHLHSIYR
jgi:hypothetical protein